MRNVREYNPRARVDTGIRVQADLHANRILRTVKSGAGFYFFENATDFALKLFRRAIDIRFIFFSLFQHNENRKGNEIL